MAPLECKTNPSLRHSTPLHAECRLPLLMGMEMGVLYPTLSTPCASDFGPLGLAPDPK